MKQVVLMGLLSVWLITLNGCQRASRTTSSTANRSKASTLPESEVWRDKRKTGIDFVAEGISPASWSMDIDFSKQIIFKPLGSSTLLATMPKPKPIGGGNGVLLNVPSGSVRNESGTLITSLGRKISPAKLGGVKVYIEPVIFRNTTTGRTYAYTVRVETGGRKYIGHGAFIKGSDRLNGTWVLETLRGQRVRAAQFPNGQLPQLVINLANNALAGNTGCNKLKGDVQAEGDHIQFIIQDMASKKCSSPFEANYLAALGQASLFRIGKDRLTLLANGEYVMTFRTENSAGGKAN
jgi:heat shock protein HslJ